MELPNYTNWYLVFSGVLPADEHLFTWEKHANQKVSLPEEDSLNRTLLCSYYSILKAGPLNSGTTFIDKAADY